MIEQFTNRYPVTKTLRFSLIPIGKTEENFNKKQLLKEDEERALKYYPVAKKVIDKYHKDFINDVLSKTYLDSDILSDYSTLYYKSDKSDKELDMMVKLEENMRTIIAKELKNDSRFNFLNKKELIRTVLPEYLSNQDIPEEDLKAVESFRDFTTYFTGFYENRKNMYTDEAKSTAIPYRCINVNLPKFLDNIKNFEKVLSALPSKDIEELDRDCFSAFGINLKNAFSLDYFNFALSQSGIDRYNGITGGYTCSDGSKVQGLNEKINLYNQQVAKNFRIPQMKPLYKQILSDSKSISFIPERFNSDEELLKGVNEFYTKADENTYSVCEAIAELKKLFDDFASFNTDGIYIKSGLPVTDLSNAVFGSWRSIRDGWNAEYENVNPPKKGKNEKYIENEDNTFKKSKSFSLSNLQHYGESGHSDDSEVTSSITKYYVSKIAELTKAIGTKYNAAHDLLTSPYNDKKKLCNNNEAIELIKDFLDSIKELEKLVKPLLGTGKEDKKDEIFYGRFVPLYETISLVDRIYDKARNYLTQKPYSTDKIKLNFDNSSFMSGWAQDYDTKGAVLFRNNGLYYLGIVDKKLSSDEKKYLAENTDGQSFEHIIYDFQKPDSKNTPRLFIRSKGTSFAPAVDKYNLPIDDIIDIYDKGYFKTQFRNTDPQKYKDSLTKIIDYFKLGFSRHESYNHYHFNWKPSEQYNNISEFYDDTISSCYDIKFEKINYNHLEEFVNNGKIYLFRIYSKDFSEYSKGNPNLHTLYFKMLFNEDNLKNIVYKLNGEAEMFYRKKSIDDEEKIIHKANNPIKNKNPLNDKKFSEFNYDIVKNKRFTSRQFSLHVPITMNFKANSSEILNSDIRKAVKSNKENYIIGIDRGERNLLYICVINSKGEIVEQTSLNEIIDCANHKVDYHELLDTKEKERDEARKSWGTIENIKELKEGYLSQVIHTICKLVLKYDAVIAMENLNFGFKNGRFKVEKQVYQKFENMLICKLNYLVDKSADINSDGGLLKAYQLTNKFNGLNKSKQNGIIFYVPAWNTSKIDPVTGFVNLLNPRYTSVDDAKNLFESSAILDVRFNGKTDMFEFDIDYSNVPRGSADFRKQWTVCTNSDRIRTFRSSENNNQFVSERVILTDEFKKLFAANGIDIGGNIKSQIMSKDSKMFFKEFIKLLALTLQMRNSVSGSTAPEDDYLISPVRNSEGVFYDSRDYLGNNAGLPADADANGAYNIARKALWAIELFKNTADEELENADISITNKQWLEYTQNI
jgi:CRISPR-associated protein Cpf1